MLSHIKSRFSSINYDGISGVTVLDCKVLVGTAENIKGTLVCGGTWSFTVLPDENVLIISQLLRNSSAAVVEVSPLVVPFCGRAPKRKVLLEPDTCWRSCQNTDLSAREVYQK